MRKLLHISPGNISHGDVEPFLGQATQTTKDYVEPLGPIRGFSGPIPGIVGMFGSSGEALLEQGNAEV